MTHGRLARISLDDRYIARSGRVLMSGTQALVRLMLEQGDRDRAAGLKTGGFVSGYRGSPLAGLDKEFARAGRFLGERRIELRPGINEELAATAVWGSQQTGLFGGADVDGVFALWYGKGAGLDRAGDAIRHGNAAGSSPRGGVVVAIGDDHVAKSSSQAHACEQACADLRLPLLYPTDAADVVRLGLHAFAMSRHSGSWVGLKIVPEVGDSTGLVEAAAEDSVLPAAPKAPPEGLHIRWPDGAVEQERRQQRHRLPAAQAYARANRLDREVLRGAGAKLGIVAAGKAWLDVEEALRLLGMNRARAEALGIALYRVSMPWPLEPEGARAFAGGLREVFVIEEKRPFVEAQLKELLFNDERRPLVTGKRDGAGAALLPEEGDLSPERIAVAIAARLAVTGAAGEGLLARAREIGGQEAALSKSLLASVARKPYFCPGCPHNTSTRVPEGSRATAGIGCHAMAMWMDRETLTWTQMGGEGATWVGLAPFTAEKHVFANLGDGTYYHSGSLAVRQAIASGINVTYKILFTRAVAMTGGQDVDGPLTVGSLVAQLRAEGVGEVVVVADDPKKYAPGELPSGVPLEPRDRLDAVQRQLRTVPGVSAIVYDQACAAESRRRRKRGQVPDPPTRAFINDLVCEGCGDCSVASNCLAVEPVATEFGHKRRINQSACNKDLSCMKGFCPSFVSVTGGKLRRPKGGQAAAGLLPSVPDPMLPGVEVAPFRILVAGVGGTGVVTVGALLAMAAHLEGKGVAVLDMTGLAQKGGAVTSSVHVASSPERIAALRIPTGQADAVLACDLVVAAGKDAMATMGAGRTRVFANGEVAPAADFIRDRDSVPATSPLLRIIEARVGQDAVEAVDAASLARSLAGEPAAANILLLGIAYQRGCVPVSGAAIERAIEINKASVEANLAAFRWGRLLAHDRQKVFAAALDYRPRPAEDEGLDALVERRAGFLAAYQDAAYARRYRALVARVRAAEVAVPGHQERLATAVAKSAFKLMAYKDEYEVARLYSEGSFARALEAEFEGLYALKVHLAPPLLARRNPATGRPAKRAFGPWILRAFRLLAGLRRLRGTALDPFGWQAERREERRMIVEYEELVEKVLVALRPANLAVAVELASLPLSVRGFGHVKERAATEMRRRRAELAPRLTAEQSPPVSIAAE